MAVKDARQYYNQECYALKKCLHCADCLAFALRYYKIVISNLEETNLDKRREEVKTLVIKFILSVISAANLPCSDALSASDLKVYINELLEGKEKLPICHYELQLLS